MAAYGYNLAPRRLRQEDWKLKISMDYTVRHTHIWRCGSLVEHLFSTMGLSAAVWEEEVKQKRSHE